MSNTEQSFRSSAPADPSRLYPPSAQQLQPPSIGLEPQHLKIGTTPVRILDVNPLRISSVILNLYATGTYPLNVFLAQSDSAFGQTNNLATYSFDPPSTVALLAPGMFARTQSNEELWAFCPEAANAAPVDLWIYRELVRA